MSEYPIMLLQHIARIQCVDHNHVQNLAQYQHYPTCGGSDGSTSAPPPDSTWTTTPRMTRTKRKLTFLQCMNSRGYLLLQLVHTTALLQWLSNTFPMLYKSREFPKALVVQSFFSSAKDKVLSFVASSHLALNTATVASSLRLQILEPLFVPALPTLFRLAILRFYQILFALETEV